MARLPEDFIDEVVSRSDIVDIVSEYVALKPSGKGYFGLCPFHNEKTPSFSVSPDRQFYHCFGCGAGGGVVSFVMQLERMEFLESIRLLAERAGMPLPNTMKATDFEKQKDLKDHLFQINRECARYYHQQLFEESSSAARAYLKKRGLSDGIIKAFGVGYAPEGWDNALNMLTGKGFALEQLVKAGVVAENQEKGRIYDRFRNRIIFPILHPRGMVLGFGGRVLDDSQPKYLNSPEGPVFNKGTTLFGLNLVRKLRPLEYTIIAEGYMDVITMHQYGFGQAVASLGTSMTAEQAKLLRRYAPDVYIAYDGDAAGQKAALRGLDILQEAGLRVKVIRFPKGKDPDETLAGHGPEYFRKLMDQALTLMEYKLEKLRDDYDLSIQDGRVAYGTEAAKLLAKTDNLIERDAHIQRLEGLIGIHPRVIYDEIRRLEGGTLQDRLKTNRTGNNRYTGEERRLQVLVPSYVKAERHLIRLMAQGEHNARRIAEGLEGQRFEEALHQGVLEMVRIMLAEGREISGPQILKNLGDPDKERKIVDIFNQEMEYDTIDTFISDCLEQVARRSLEKQLEVKRSEIADMEQNGIPDPEAYTQLRQDLMTLSRRVQRRQTGKEGLA